MWLEKLFDKISMDVSHQFNQSPQQKPGIKTILGQQKHFQLGLNERGKKKWGRGTVMTSGILQMGPS